MIKLLNVLFSIIYWLFFIVTSIFIFPLYLITFFLTFIFDRKRVIVHYFTRLWALFYLYINPWIKFEVEGLNKIDKKKTYIIISNHQSMLDIFVLYILPIHFIWISKIEIFKIPVVGQIMKLNKYIPLERGNKESISKMYAIAENRLKDSISILIFPEGTRSEDGNLKKFKEGAFNLSLKTGKPVLMVVIDGAYKVLPKNSIFFEKRSKIIVKVIGEISVTNNTNEITKNISTVENIYSQELDKLRKVK